MELNVPVINGVAFDGSEIAMFHNIVWINAAAAKQKLENTTPAPIPLPAPPINMDTELMFHDGVKPTVIYTLDNMVPLINIFKDVWVDQCEEFEDLIDYIVGKTTVPVGKYMEGIYIVKALRQIEDLFGGLKDYRVAVSVTCTADILVKAKSIDDARDMVDGSVYIDPRWDYRNIASEHDVEIDNEDDEGVQIEDVNED